MDIKVIETVAKFAGLGGIALGTLLFLFREFIQRTIFPSLTKTQAYNLLKLFLFLTWSAAVLGMAAWVYVEREKNSHTVPVKPEAEESSDTTAKKSKILESTTRSFTTYIVGWKRLREITALQNEKKGNLTESQKERKKTYAQERSESRGTLLSELKVAKLYYDKDVLSLIEQFEKWDEAQSKKHLIELPPMEEWELWHAKVSRAMKREVER